LSPARADVTTPSLTFESIRARPVLLKLQRPIVARIATITEWPLILIDLTTREGIVGRDRLRDDVAALEAIRRAVGDDMHLMADFNQGLDLGEALQRCHRIDDM